MSSTIPLLKKTLALCTLCFLIFHSYGQVANDTICPGDSALLVAPAGTLYHWSTGNSTDTITAATAGTYTVTVTSSGGSTATYTYVVTVNGIVANGLTLIGTAAQPSGTLFTKLQSVIVKGQYAYVATGATPGGLCIYDISTPSHPTLVNSVSTYGPYMTALQGNYAYQAGNQKIYAINIANPLSIPTPYTFSLASYSVGTIFNLCVSGNFLYAATSGKGLVIIDITNPASFALAFIEGGTTNNSAGVAISGNTVFTSNYSASPFTIRSLKTWNVTNPYSPVLQNALTLPSTFQPTEVKVFGNYAYVRDDNNPRVGVIDVTVPAMPVYMSSLATSYGYYNNAGITYVDGNNAYLFSGTNGGAIQIYNIASPASPVLISTTTVLPTGSYAIGGGTGAGGYIYDAVYGPSGGASGYLAVYRIPTLNHNDTICAGDTATLTAPGNGTYIWSNGDTGVSIYATATGIYTVTITNGTGCTAVISDTLTVYPIPTVNNDTVCAGNPATLTATGGGTYLWNTGATTASITSDTAGVFTVTVTNTLGCSATASGRITINANPTLTVNNDTICAGATATLTATGGITYVWSTGDTTSFIHQNRPGIYTVTVTNAAGCTATDSGTITVIPNPAINVNSGTVCGSSAAVLIATGAISGSTYLWSTGSMADSISVITVGIYTVTVTSPAGCTAIAHGAVTGCNCDTINMHPSISFSDTTFCVGTTVEIYCTSTGQYGDLYIDDTTNVGLAPMATYTAGIPVVLTTAKIGIHHLVFITYYANPDSFDSPCADTAYITATVRNCACDSLNPHVTLSDTSVCLGSPLTIFASGGWGGQLFYDSTAITGIVPISSFAPYIIPGASDSSLGNHTITIIIYASEPSGTPNCSDTLKDTFNITNCCTPPHAHLSINGDTTAIDTICLGSGTVIIRAIGGTWGSIYTDSISNGYTGIIPDTGIIFIIPQTDSTDLGIHTLCFLSYTDSTKTCGDTICYTIIEIYCNCVKPVPHLSINGNTSGTDTICFGSTIIVKFTGGQWGQFIQDDSFNIFGGYVQIPDTGLTDTIQANDPTQIGIHHVCFTAYNDTTTACDSTVCATVYLKVCNCNSYSPIVASQQTGPLTWQFWSTSSPAPTFLQWYVDDTLITQTTPSDTFTFTFSNQGVHHVCMTGGYITPNGNGTSYCCYETTCDTILIDYCNIWRATDSIGYAADSLDFHIIHFTYYGVAPTSMTWIFDNGDTIVNSGASVTDSFSDGYHSVCAYLVWSLHDSANCCCVDTICLGVPVGPCYLLQLAINEVDSMPGAPVFMPSPAYTTINTYGNYTISGMDVHWLLNGTPDGSGITYAPAVTTSGIDTIGMIVSYGIYWGAIGNLLPGGDKCTDTIYGIYPLSAPAGRDGFRAYPNPTGGSFVVEITSYQENNTAKMEVIDLTGRTVSQKAFTDIHKGTNNVYMNVAGLPQGIYELRMIMGNATQVSKLVKQ